MHKVIMILLVAFSHVGAISNAEKAQKMKETELNVLKEYLELARDSLQMETTNRYNLKQQLIQQRETDKERFDQMHDDQERLLNDLSRIKEEVLVKQQQLDEQEKTAQQKAEEWNFVKSSLNDLLSKEATSVQESFPIDMGN